MNFETMMNANRRCAVLLFVACLAPCEGLSVAPPSKIQESLKAAERIHQEECQYGFESFGRKGSIKVQERTFTDDDFQAHPVGKKNCGPDVLPKNGDVVFQSKESLVSAAECQALIDEARERITEELANIKSGENSDRPTNSELGEARVSTLPKGREWLLEKMHSTLFPLLRDRFGVSDNLTLHDALIIGYGYFGTHGMRSQPVHRDSSILSLNVALSPQSDYVGGGTYFEALGKNLHQDQGHVTCHAGGIMHAGHSITSGERWVLVLFVLDEERPQIARRCHALGLEAQREGKIEEAKTHFDAALTDCKENHLIYKDLGRTFMQESNVARARGCLRETVQLYPLDVASGLALANLLVQAKRPRAALRQLEKLLASPQLSDEAFFNADTWQPLRSQGWEARMLSASCAMQCAHRAPASCSKMLPTAALQRLEICLQAAPNAPNLQEMIDAARQMYAAGSNN